MGGYTYNLGQRLEQIVKHREDGSALIYPEGRTITFNELWSLSDGMCGFLLKNGARKGDVVAIFNDKSPEGFAMMFAALRLGVIYTNLDVHSPPERLVKILDRCSPKFVFHDSTLGFEDGFFREKLGRNSKNLQNITGDDSLRPPNWEVTGSDPAYIMFTSGSTGFPKGAVMTNDNLLNLIDWARTAYDITYEDVQTNVNPIYFDNSVFDLYSSVFNGAAMAPIRTQLTKEPRKLVAAVESTGCTRWFSVPSMLVFLLTTKAIGPENFPVLRDFMFGGEGFPKPKLKKLFELFGSRARLFNVYGPTECTCICSSYQIGEEDLEDLTQLAPLGTLIPNFDFEILNSNDGIGELFLKGPGVGLGYYNDSERTDNAFTSVSNSHRGWGYRTGDLVELDEQGFLHFRGRSDNQIKHMGYRIELEEIEAAIMTIDDVDETAVIYRLMGAGLGLIEAFIATKHPMEDDFYAEALEKKLPAYMLPKRISVMEVLPKNQNGKIDRKAL